MALTVILLLGSYLLGSTPFGPLVAQRQRIDLRQVGSGNIGASNAARALGWRWGIVVLLLDAAKGLLPVLLARELSGDLAYPQALSPLAMIAAVAGHIWSVFLRFRGGKGVSTALGATLAISPLTALLALLTFASVYGIFRIPALGSLLGAGVALGVAWIGPMPTPHALGITVVVGMVLFRHRSNLRRLAQGGEHRL